MGANAVKDTQEVAALQDKQWAQSPGPSFFKAVLVGIILFVSVADANQPMVKQPNEEKKYRLFSIYIGMIRLQNAS